MKPSPRIFHSSPVEEKKLDFYSPRMGPPPLGVVTGGFSPSPTSKNCGVAPSP